MVFCKICKGNIGFMGWPNHVRMHKRKAEKMIGHWPTWDEVLECFGIVPKPHREDFGAEPQPAKKRFVTLEDF